MRLSLKLTPPPQEDPWENLTDVELVARTKKGNKDTYRVLVERYQTRIVALAYNILKDKIEAEDVAQEAFVKAYLSIADFKGDSSFLTWLYRITYNMAIDVRRKLTRRGMGFAMEVVETEKVGDIAESSVQSHIDDPEQALGNRQVGQVIRGLLNQLTPEHRSIVILREMDGLSYEEIAEVTGVTKGTVMSRLFYARKKLQQGLEAQGLGRTVLQDESKE
jgi:RNA polymerase sigma-70 factor (ECF subfamily)